MKEILIGVDNGNGNTKGDTGFVIQSGVKKLVVRPPFDTKTVKWKGEYYAVGASKTEIQKSKVSNNDTLILTMAAIAEKLNMGNKGMMTVEASVVVPIILIIVVTEFFFGLFLIDMSVVKSETMRLADEAADVWKTDGKLADGTYKSQQLLLRNKNFLQKNRRGQLISKTRLRLQKRIATRLNIASLDSYKVSISGGKVLVQASVRLGNPLLGGRKYTGIKGWIFKCEEKADITNEEELLRKLSGNLR